MGYAVISGGYYLRPDTADNVFVHASQPWPAFTSDQGEGWLIHTINGDAAVGSKIFLTCFR